MHGSKEARAVESGRPTVEGFPGGSDGKGLQCRRFRFDHGIKWQPTLVLLPGQFRGQSCLGVYSP